MRRMLWRIIIFLCVGALSPVLASIEDEGQIQERTSLKIKCVQENISPTSAHLPVAPGYVRQEDWTDKIVRWCVLSGLLTICGCIEVIERRDVHEKHRHLE